MKYIIKNSEPLSFTKWKRDNPRLGYKDLKDVTKQDLKIL